MFYVRAYKENGQLIIETVDSFIDDSYVLEEAEFLHCCSNITEDYNGYDATEGIISADILDILQVAYPSI